MLGALKPQVKRKFHDSYQSSYQPFRKGPLPPFNQQQNQRGRGRGVCSAATRFSRRGNFRGNFRGKDKKTFSFSLFTCKYRTHLKQISSKNSSSGGLPTCAFLNKISFSKQNSRISRFSREIEVFSKKLDKTDKRLCQSSTSEGVQNSFSNSSNPKFCSEAAKIQCKGRRDNFQGSSGNVREGCHKGSLLEENFIFKPYLCGREKGWGSPSGDKSKVIKQFYSFYTFQDGGPTTSERDNAKRGLFSKIRSEGRIFRSSLGRKFSAVREHSMERENLSVSLLVFWTRSCPKAIHKINEDTSCSNEKTKLQAHYISGRHTVICSNSFRSKRSKGHVDIPPSESEVSDQFQKISSHSLSPSRISRDDDKLIGNENVFPTGKGRQNCKAMSKFDSTGGGVCPRPFQIDRKAVFHSLSSITSPIALQVFTSSTDSYIDKQGILQCHSSFISGRQRGTEMVDKQSLSEQRQYCNLSTTGNDNKLRCLNGGLGSGLKECVNGRPVVGTCEETPHK